MHADITYFAYNTHLQVILYWRAKVAGVKQLSACKYIHQRRQMFVEVRTTDHIYHTKYLLCCRKSMSGYGY
mgnify:CR=1 FL=1